MFTPLLHIFINHPFVPAQYFQISMHDWLLPQIGHFKVSFSVGDCFHESMLLIRILQIEASKQDSMEIHYRCQTFISILVFLVGDCFNESMLLMEKPRIEASKQDFMDIPTITFNTLHSLSKSDLIGFLGR